MKKIIVISGKQYSGKDTLAKILLNLMPEYKRIGIGDAIKIEYGKRNNLTFAEIEKNKHQYRKDLIELGNWGRAQDNDYWLKNLAGMNKIIVPDIRVEHEANFFKSQGAFLIRVNSSFENRSKRGIIVNNDDPTEIALDNYDKWNISDYDSLVIKANEVLDKFDEFLS